MMKKMIREQRHENWEERQAPEPGVNKPNLDVLSVVNSILTYLIRNM